jgi:ADP-heptose:LPS heptosyltransferase
MDKKRFQLAVLDAVLQTAKSAERRYYKGRYRELKSAEPLSWPPLPSPIRDILIFKPDDIGDAIQALPAIGELKEKFPGVRLSLICQEKTAPVYERSRLFDVIVPVKVTARFVRFQSLDLEAALKLLPTREIDIAIFLRTYPVFFEQFKKIPARVMIHPRDPRLRSPSPYQARVEIWDELRPHQALQLLQIVAPLTQKNYAVPDIRYPAFHWKPEDEREASLALGANLPERFGVLHPFNRFETKSYPVDQWPFLIERLKERFSFPWLVIGGKEDPPFFPEKGLVQLQGKMSLGATGFLMSKAEAFVGNESGPAHWAAALGVPTVTLMGGHSNPEEWSPLGRSLVLRHDVPCGPCHLRVCTRHGLQCFTGISAKQIWPRIESFLP